jgi:hypothetical protein
MANKPTKAPKKAVVKNAVKPVKNQMMGVKAMPNVKQMMASEKMIEKKTANKPKTAAEKKLEQKISKQTGKAYKGKR